MAVASASHGSEGSRRVAGGLYHVNTRGNNRRQIFNAPTDYENFLSLLAIQGPNPTQLSEVTSMSRSAVSRRYDAARLKVEKKHEMVKLVESILERYRQR